MRTLTPNTKTYKVYKVICMYTASQECSMCIYFCRYFKTPLGN